MKRSRISCCIKSGQQRIEDVKEVGRTVLMDMFFKYSGEDTHSCTHARPKVKLMEHACPKPIETQSTFVHTVQLNCKGVSLKIDPADSLRRQSAHLPKLLLLYCRKCFFMTR